MLPTDRRINQQHKKAKIPTRKLIENRSDIIISYWINYQQAMPLLFKSQIEVALGGNNQSLDTALKSLCKKSDYLIHDRGHEAFSFKYKTLS